MKRFHIITLFPDMFSSYLGDSILKRAQESGHIAFHLYNPRDMSVNKHKSVDDTPYGGGPGMVLSVQPIIDTVEKIYSTYNLARKDVQIILTTPGGKDFTNSYAKNAMHEYDDVIIICGRYEGIDSRVQEILKADEISIGDYILTGGELPAMVMIDAMSRQVKGVLGNNESIEEERASSHKMYTRPEVYRHNGVEYRAPEVLLSGDHKKIEEWRSASHEN